jgi:hypothetical protein
MLLICLPVGLPSRLGAVAWQHGSPSGFSIYCSMGKLCAGWGCGSVRVLPLLGGFFLSGVSPASQENFYFKEHMLSSSSL